MHVSSPSASAALPASPVAKPPSVFGSSNALSLGAGAEFAEAWLLAAERLGAHQLYLTGDEIGAQLAKATARLLENPANMQVTAVDAVLGAVLPGESGETRFVPQAARAQAASLDRSEAETAVAVAQAAISWAADLGAPYVVVALGTAGRMQRLWHGLRGSFLRGVLQYDDDRAREFMAVRASLSRRYLDASMRSIERIVDAASRRGVAVLLRNPRRPIDLPTTPELSALRAELRGAPLFPLLDLPAAHLTSMLHCVPLRETVLAFGDGPLACLADACGAVGGLLPGQGEVDVAAVAGALPPSVQRAFLPWPGLSLREAVAGYQAVASL